MQEVIKNKGYTMTEWKFEEYTKISTECDPSSEKFFRDAKESDSLIREFIQNSLDARENNISPVKVKIHTPALKKEFKKAFLHPLKLVYNL